MWKIGDVVGFVPREEPLNLTALDQTNWCVIQTERGREMTAQANFILMKVPFYLPTILRPVLLKSGAHERSMLPQRQVSHKEVVRPLFPRLLFVPEQVVSTRLASSRYMPGISRYPLWRFAERPAILTPNAMQAIRYIEAGERELYERGKGLQNIGYKPAINDEVKILVSSVTSNVKGRISAIDERGRIILLVGIMKRQVRVHVTADQITPV